MEEPMTIKDILVHVDPAPATGARLEAALTLARQFEARLTALYLLAEPFLRAGAGHHAPAEIVREHLAHAEAEAEAALAGMREAAAGQGVTLLVQRETGSLDRLPGLLARDARNTDLVVVGQPNPETGSSDEALLVEAAFMETGRPALMVPHGGAPALPPRRVMVAWDASREASRAVHDALPLLRLAEEVVVLVVDARSLGARIGRQPGSGVAAHLAQHGVAVRVERVESDRRGGGGMGEFILAQAEVAGSDLLVMGGYGHSRFREMLLGGVTRHMLEQARLPIIFAH
jgi:nucleotide-binding universal stress UspA family protein